MARKFGLGKGLDDLLPTQPKEAVKQPAAEQPKELDLNKIKPNKKQARKVFDEEKLLELTESIKEHGIIQPLVVMKAPTGQDYVIVAGERRYRAAKKAGLKSVPVVYASYDEQELLEVSLIENIQRQDLNPVEEAGAYKVLMDQFHLTQEEISRRVGKSRAAVANTVRLMNLDRRVLDYLSDGVITEGHGRALLAVADKDLQYRICQKVIDEGMSVRQLEAYIKNYDKMKDLRSRERKKDVFLQDLEKRIGGYLGTKVTFKAKTKNRGRIEIEYYNQDDLDRILEILHVDE